MLGVRRLHLVDVEQHATKITPEIVMLLVPTRAGGHERDGGVRRTTDQLRTTTSALGKHQRSTVDSGEKSFTLSHRHGPIWGSKSHEFLSCPLPP